MQTNPRRHRPPRAPNNPMAQLARQIVDAAVEAAGKADTLSMQMEPHLQRLLSNSAIYSYTNDRAVPPGDVLLAAALAGGLSVDERLGIVRRQADVERQVVELRAEVEQLRGEVSDLRAQDRPEAEKGGVDASRRSQRRKWAQQAPGSPPSDQPPQSRRSSGRGPAM